MLKSKDMKDDQASRSEKIFLQNMIKKFAENL